ncbi:membrane protein insertase YidC [Paenibacillus sp. N1-5-1-14]|uniref:membrane protein insertase YidC n=1 Tax=Paenibacillus radicibacter TaxID=2972488 RepID=UPI0021598232|nr:membrane protein insertase YidC [Paenibacillus radicibacter]MCR8643006.1 membrane protein insertase YidC [Paenibacillus radicibacter]
MNRRWFVALPFLFMILLLTGCGNTTALPMLDDSGREAAGFFVKYFVIPLVDLLDILADVLFSSYGLAIIAITILIRLVILPLSIKQFRSSKKMQDLQPEMKKLREQFKDDPKKQQEESMKLFQKHGVNPLAGCFPVLIQMPILLALYQSIMRNPSIAGHEFLWYHLDKPEPYVLPILAALTTFGQQLFMKSQMNQQMQMLLFVFPVLIYIMAIQFPAALTTYWIVGNVFTIIQYYFMYGGFNSTKPEVSPAATPSKKGSKKKG